MGVHRRIETWCAIVVVHHVVVHHVVFLPPRFARGAMAMSGTLRRSRKLATELWTRWSTSQARGTDPGEGDGGRGKEGRGRGTKDVVEGSATRVAPAGRGRGRAADAKEGPGNAGGLMARVGAVGAPSPSRSRRSPAPGRRRDDGRPPSSATRDERFAPPADAGDDAFEDVPWDAGRSSEQAARATRRRWTSKPHERESYPKEKSATSSTKRRDGAVGGPRRRTDAQAWYGDVNVDDRNRRNEGRIGGRTARNRYDNVVTTKRVTLPETDFEQVDERALRRYWFLKYHPSLQLNLDLKPPRFADPNEDAPTEEELDRQFLEQHETELRTLCQAEEDTVAWEKDKAKALSNMREARSKARAKAVRNGESGYNDVMREERELHAIVHQLPQDHPERNLAQVAVKTLCANPDWKFQQKREFLVQMVEALQEEIDPKFNLFDF